MTLSAFRIRLRFLVAMGAVLLVAALAIAPASVADPALSGTHHAAKVCDKQKRCHHTRASHLRAGEFCKKCAQRFYRRHGYTCKRASDGRLRLFRR
jgi:hypothetical protein